MAKGSKHARQRFRKWINSYTDVAAWLEKHGDIEQQLDDNGGLVKIHSFLPTFVAEGILDMLQGIDEKTWNVGGAHEVAAGVDNVEQQQQQQQQQQCSSLHYRYASGQLKRGGHTHFTAA
jgi:hypothetical protein